MKLLASTEGQKQNTTKQKESFTAKRLMQKNCFIRFVLLSLWLKAKFLPEISLTARRN